MTIKNEVRFIFSLILSIFILTSLYNAHNLNNISIAINQSNLSYKLLNDILQMRRHEKNFILRGEMKYADLVKEYSAQFLSGVALFKKINHKKENQKRIDAIISGFEFYQRSLDSYIRIYKDTPTKPESQELISSGREILSIGEQLHEDAAFSLATYMARIRKSLFLGSILSFIICFVAFILTCKTIVKPIRQLKQLCNRVGKEGAVDLVPLSLVDRSLQDIKPHNEIGELAHAYREMIVRYYNSRLALQRRMEEVENLYKLKSEFASMVSHELRTPLTPISESIDLVLDKSLGPINEEQEKFLEIANKNLDRLSRLINDVLDFSKLTSSKQEFKKENVIINDLIESVINIYKLQIEKKGLSLVVKLQATKGLEMELDADRINQVLTNLINNAIKFTDEGQITVYTNRGDERNFVKVCIEDTGHGIRREDVDKLFQPFVQLKAWYDRKTGGTGLGLAISKEIIEHSGGRIWVESEFGKGSTFCFILPMEERRKS